MSNSTASLPGSYSPNVVLRLLEEHQVKRAADAVDIQFLYAIYDNRSGEFAPPAVSYSGFVIARGIAEIVARNPSSPIALYPGDFALYCLGTYNIRSGHIIPYSHPQPLGTIRTILESVKPADLTAFLASVKDLTASQPKPESAQ